MYFIVLSVYYNIVTWIFVVFLFLLSYKSAYQCKSSYTTNKHKDYYQKFAGIAQSRCKIKAGAYRTQSRYTFKDR